VRVVLVFATVVAVSACSGGGGASGDSDLRTKAVCGLMVRLAESAEPVEEVDVADPARFETALDEAVGQYVATVDELRELVPDELDDDLDQLEAAASQYRFEDALAARIALDEYAQATCAGPVTTTGGTG
jgi:hypothetical protein